MVQRKMLLAIMKKSVCAQALFLWFALLSSPSYSNDVMLMLRASYCAKNWTESFRIADAQYRSHIGQGQKFEKGWQDFRMRVQEFLLGKSEPSVEEWRSMGCELSSQNNTAPRTVGSGNVSQQPANVFVGADGRVIDLSNLSVPSERLSGSSFSRNFSSASPGSYSRSSYSGSFGSGNCDTPSDVDAAGRRCGRRAASARSGGR